jgi:hypothetical protein
MAFFLDLMSALTTVVAWDFDTAVVLELLVAVWRDISAVA